MTKCVTPCRHLVAIPEGYKLGKLDTSKHGTLENPKWNGEMAKNYQFQLDTFQSTAVACIVRFF